MTTAAARDELDDKVNRLFAGKVVRKDLVRKVKVGANVPVFVLEFLLGKYCASSDDVAIQMGLQVVNDTLADNYIRADESMKAQATVKDRGRHTFIDKVKVRLVDSDYWAELSNFGHKNVHIPEHYISQYERLVMGGVWAHVDMRFESDEETRGKNPFWIDKLTPIQIATFDLDDYRRVRRDFTTDEWLDLMLRSMGYLQSKKTELGVARDLEVSDLHVEVLDLLANRVEAELGVAFFVASYSALRKAPVTPALLVLGDMSIQGNIKPLRSLTEPLQVAKDNGAKRALIPIENKRSFLDVSADIMEHVDPIFYGDPKTAAMKVLGNA